MADMNPADVMALAKGTDDDHHGGMWAFLLIILFFICTIGGFGNNQPAPAPQQGSVLDATLASAGAQGGFVTQSDLDSALHMQTLQQGQRDITAGVSQSKYDITGALSDTESRITSALGDLHANQQSNAQAMQSCCAETKFAIAQAAAQSDATTTAQTQRVLDALAQDKAERLARENAEKDREIAQMRAQLDAQQRQAQTDAQFGAINSRLNMMPTYPNQYAYNAGPSPFCGCMPNSCCVNA